MARTAAQNATYPQKIAALVLIAFESGHPFVCSICGEPIAPGQVIQFDHSTAVGRGGANETKDIRPVHYEKPPLDCHQRKTWGGSAKATTLGSDTHEYWKVERLLGNVGNKPKKKIQSRQFQKPPEGYKAFPKRSMRASRYVRERT